MKSFRHEEPLPRECVGGLPWPVALSPRGLQSLSEACVDGGLPGSVRALGVPTPPGGPTLEARVRELEAMRLTASSIAHDLNNFLTSMFLNVHIASRHADATPALAEILEDVARALPHARELTQQLLTLTRQRPRARRGTQVADLIRTITTFSLRGSHVVAEMEVDDGLWEVDMEACHVGQVVNNLVVNANQAMPRGGILRLCVDNVTVGPEDGDPRRSAPLQPVKEGHYVLVRVQDQGEGIPQSRLAAIFQPGFTTRSDGSGLGLATCRALLEARGGHIHVESSVGHGTCFHVYFPALPPVGSIPGVETCVTAPRLLLVDEDDNLCRGVVRVMERRGIEVEAVSSEAEAVERAGRARAVGRSFDAVVVDVTDRGCQAIGRTLQHLRGADPGMRAIASSVNADDAMVRLPHLHGFTTSVRKPYDADELWLALEQASVVPKAT